jgi:hypothetical protein
VILLLDVEASKNDIEDIQTWLLREYIQQFFEMEDLSLIIPESGTFAIFRGGPASPVLHYPEFWTCRRVEAARGTLSRLVEVLGLRGPRSYLYDPKQRDAELRFHGFLRDLQMRLVGNIDINHQVNFLDNAINTPVEIEFRRPGQFTFVDMVWGMYLQARAVHARAQVVKPY